MGLCDNDFLELENWFWGSQLINKKQQSMTEGTCDYIRNQILAGQRQGMRAERISDARDYIALAGRGLNASGSAAQLIKNPKKTKKPPKKEIDEPIEVQTQSEITINLTELL